MYSMFSNLHRNSEAENQCYLKQKNNNNVCTSTFLNGDIWRYVWSKT